MSVSPRRHQRRPPATSSLVVLLVFALSAACDRAAIAPSSESATAQLPDIAGMVVGPAADALGADGQLRLAVVAPNQTARTEISESQARKLAQAYVLTHARGERKILERDHGGPINLDALHVCGRVWYASSAFEPLPSDVPAAFHRIYGPWWLVTLCGPGEAPQVSVAVSAYSTELTIRSDGRLAYPPEFGEEMHVLGIPTKLAAGVPSAPERAVSIAARLTGVRVAGVPELIAPPPGQFPQTARWRLPLERGVALTAGNGKGSPVRTFAGVREVFVSTTKFASPNTAEIADVDQPATRSFTYRVGSVLGSTRAQIAARRSATVSVVRRRAFPVRYLTAEGN